MSLLVHYTLKSAEDHAAQVKAMQTFVEGLKSESLQGVEYSCFETDDPTRFVGVLEFENDTCKETFLQSPAFATYRDTVGRTFTNPPEANQIVAIASTRT